MSPGTGSIRDVQCCIPSQIKYPTPTHRIHSNNAAEVNRTVASPANAMLKKKACETAAPTIVQIERLNPCCKALDTTTMLVGPGITIRTIAAAKKAKNASHVMYHSLFVSAGVTGDLALKPVPSARLLSKVAARCFAYSCSTRCYPSQGGFDHFQNFHQGLWGSPPRSPSSVKEYLADKRG